LDLPPSIFIFNLNCDLKFFIFLVGVGINDGIQKLLIFTCLFLGLVSGCSTTKKSQPHRAEITISAATSMQNALEELRVLYTQKHPQTNIVFNFGSSGSLQHQIEQGAVVDIFISAAPKQMNSLAAEKLLLSKTRHDLVKNKMVLIVPDKNKSIDSFADLADRSVEKIALGEPTTVPAGQYAREILTSLGLINEVKPKVVYGTDVRQVFNYVATGNTDAGIVYRTDALDNKQVKIVDVARESSHSPVVYPVAIIKESKNIQAAQQVLQFLLSAEAQTIFQRNGFVSINSN
jgi:molybdate transport system substrate-binding protein